MFYVHFLTHKIGLITGGGTRVFNRDHYIKDGAKQRLSIAESLGSQLRRDKVYHVLIFLLSPYQFTPCIHFDHWTLPICSQLPVYLEDPTGFGFESHNTIGRIIGRKRERRIREEA